MLGLQGNNVKLNLKPIPDSPVRKKSNAKARTLLDTAAASAISGSDSDSGVGLRSGRRISSASTSRASTSRLMTRMPPRKLSEPVLKLSAKHSPPPAPAALKPPPADCGRPRRRFSTSDEPLRAEVHHPVYTEPEIPSREYEPSISPSATPSTSVDLDGEGGSSPELEIPPIHHLEDLHHDHEEKELSAYDQMLLEESDNLIQDVMTMCSEMGIDSSGIIPAGTGKGVASSSAAGGKVKMEKHVTIVSPVQESSTPSEHSTKSESSSATEVTTHGPQKLDTAQLDTDSGSTYDRIMSTLRLIEADERQEQQDSNLQQARSQFDDFQPPFDARMQTPSAASHHSASDPSIGLPSESEVVEQEERPRSVASCTCPTPSPRDAAMTEKSRSIYSFLDQVEKSDRDVLFSLKFEQNRPNLRANDLKMEQMQATKLTAATVDFDFDSLVRKGSVELAKELLLLQRKYEDTAHAVRVLEDTLLSQRELNMRNLHNAERDLQKRLRLQKEEFELALSRHQTFVDQLIAEKRALQDKSEKALQVAQDSEQKHQSQVKALQDKHLEELKRVRRAKEESARVHRVKWANDKTHEIQSNTVKNLAPEVQRLITRHQQEMVEARAWHADELRAIEERYARKQASQMAEMREAMAREKGDVHRRERETHTARLEAERVRWREEFEAQQAKLVAGYEEEKRGWIQEKAAIQQASVDSLRRMEARMEVELETKAQEYTKKLQGMEARHTQELRALQDVHTAEKANLQQSAAARQEQALLEAEARLRQAWEEERALAVAEAERRLREEYKRLRRDEEEASDARMKRLGSKLKAEISELENAESGLKHRLSTLKSELTAQQDQCASLQAALAQKERQALDLNEANMKMVEERVNLTSVIRREFAHQIEELEDDSRMVKASLVELKTKHKLELEARAADAGRALTLKDEELERVAVRVKQTLERKEETLEELRNQLDMAREQIRSLEQLLEEQRREFLGEMVTNSASLLHVGAKGRKAAKK